MNTTPTPKQINYIAKKLSDIGYTEDLQTVATTTLQYWMVVSHLSPNDVAANKEQLRTIKISFNIDTSDSLDLLHDVYNILKQKKSLYPEINWK